MSQIDEQNQDQSLYDTDGSSALKKSANTAAKNATKKVAQKATKKVAQKVGAALARAAGALLAKVGWPVWLTVAIVFFVVIIGSSLFVMFTASTGTQEEEQVTTESAFWGGDISQLGENAIPADYIPIYKEAEKKYGVPWNLLAAEHKVETNFSTIKNMISPVGATGHLQFMPCTWVGWGHPSCGGLGLGNIPKSQLTDLATIKRFGGYGVDGDGDKKADPDNLKDAIFSAANYLAASGAAEGRMREAVFTYNHAGWYVDRVMGYADSYVKGYVAVSGGSQTSGGAASGVAVIDKGKTLIGKTRYVFGGGRSQSDINAGRFDCSSFVHWAFKQTGVDLGPLTSTSTETLKHLGKPISPNNMKPGDVVFFDTYKIDGHVGIYVGDNKFIGCQGKTGVAIASMAKGTYFGDKFNGRVKRI